MTSEPTQLRCKIVDRFRLGSAQGLAYIVTDPSGIVIAEGVSSSEAWVRRDAGGHHTKRTFDQLFPAGWVVSFEF